MAQKDYYGNFSGYEGPLSEIPAFTLSTDPEHMPELVGHGFKIAGAIVPSRTWGLDQIESSTDTRVHAYADHFEELTGKRYHVAMSEDALSRRVTGTESVRAGDSVYDELHDPLQTRFSRRVIDHMRRVRGEHGRILVFPYMISSGLNGLEEAVGGEGVHVISPRLEVKERLADKATMYDHMNRVGVKTVEGKVVASHQEAAQVFREKREEWGGEAFVSAMGGAGGNGCLHAFSTHDIQEKFGDYDPEKRLIITRWLPNIRHAPNVMVFVDDERPHVLMVSDQIIENGTQYSGNSFPLQVDDAMHDTVIRESLKVGEEMRKAGYRGIGGIDGIIADGEFYYVEINPRKNHSSVVNVGVMEQFRPDNMPPLSHLEAQLLLSEKPSSFDFREWTEAVTEARLTYDMYLLKKSGWMKMSDLPEGERMPDHQWDLQTSYFASIPCVGEGEDSDVIIPKSYAALKSEGHTRRVTPVEIARIVTPNRRERLRQIKRMDSAVRNM